MDYNFAEFSKLNHLAKCCPSTPRASVHILKQAVQEPDVLQIDAVGKNETHFKLSLCQNIEISLLLERKFCRRFTF